VFAWALYAICISLTLGLAAATAEHVYRLRRRPTRWIWLSALIASILIPATISFVSIEVPQYSSVAHDTVLVRLRDTTAQSLAPERWVANVGPVNTPDADAVFATAWIAGAVSVALFIVCLCVHWMRRTRSWERTELRGEVVYVADEVGPAVVGFFRPCIVLPRWALTSSHIDAVLAHEREHIDAHDPQLLLASLAFVCVMPWNLPLWWTVGRLRRAIEIDCDTRVVRGGRDAVAYGSLLLDINQRQPDRSLAVVALTERASFLETRIRIMLAARSPLWRWSAAALTFVSVAMIATAAHVKPPSFFASQRAIAVSDETFDALGGYYHFGGQMVMRVGRDGERRFVKLSGQRAWPIRAQSTHRWVSTSPDGEYEFELNERGDVERLGFRQNGNAYTARRVSASTGQELERAFAAKVSEQTPTPGSEEAVRRVVGELLKDRPDYSLAMPGLESNLRRNITGRRAELQSYGALRGISFAGVTAGGSDIYKVEFERWTEEVTIRMAPDGRISRLSFDEWSSPLQRDALAERFQRQKPHDQSEAILAGLIETVRAGKPNYEDLSPGMAATVREQLASLQLGVVSFGKLQSITFDRVAPNGWDVFSVRFDHAVIACSIELRRDGKVTGLLWDM
jgi:bla regulator protein blaR1